MKKVSVFILFILCIVACRDKISSLSVLKSNFYEFKEKPLYMGDTLQIRFQAHEDKIDSVVILLNEKPIKNNERIDFSNAHLGMNKLQMKVYIDGDFIWADTQAPILSPIEETPVKFKIVNEYPHPKELFTQGFLFHDNKIFESAGQYKKSKLVTYSLGSTNYIQEIKQSDQTFSEGIALLNDKIYQLTYRQRDIFVYDAKTLALIETKRLPDFVKEGWGLTSYDGELLVSDGTQFIYFFDENFNLNRKIQVTGNISIFTHINELELIEGKIYANVFTTNYILIIDPNTGAVEQYYDLTSISETQGSEDVLNGIARYGDNILVTGKHWSTIYEISPE